MNWLDVLLVALFALSVLLSFRRGFSREAVGLGAALAALFLGIWFYGLAGEWLLPYVSSKGVANFCGFLIVFAGVLLAGALVSRLLSRLIKFAGLSWFDRLLGAGFGALRGVVLSTAVVVAMVAFTPGSSGSAPPRAVVDSRLAPYVIEAASVVTALAPYEVREGFRKTYARVKKIWKHSLGRGVQDLPTTEL